MQIFDAIISVIAGMATTIIAYYQLSPTVFKLLNLFVLYGAPSGLIESVKSNYLIACILSGIVVIVLGFIYATTKEYDRYYEY